MIQITAIQVETNQREVTAYLSLVDKDIELDGFRLIWVEQGHQRQSKVTWVARDTPVLEILAKCYENKEPTSEVAL
jgi:hypothetical protein